MRKLIFLGLLLYLCSVAFGKVPENDKFILSGKITGAGEKGGVGYTDTEGKFQLVPVEFRDGDFRVEIGLKEPQVVKLNFRDARFIKQAGKGYIPANSSSMMFVAIPGKELKVTGTLTKDFIDIYPEGNKENKILSRYTSAMHPVLNEAVNGMVEAAKNPDMPANEKAELEKKGEELDARMQQIRTAFLDKHVSSIAGLWLLEDMLIRTQIDIEQAKAYFNQVAKSYRQTTYYKNIATRIAGSKASAIGQMAPDIRTRNTYDGKEFDLKNLRGKYVLIDFWGTWCWACIAGMPEMKKFAEKHADKLVLLGIAQESNRDRWKNYLDKSEWNWQQVMVGEGEEDFVLRYNVQGFPTKILLSPEGKILKRLVGEEPQFYTELEELMQ